MAPYLGAPAEFADGNMIRNGKPEMGVAFLYFPVQLYGVSIFFPFLKRPIPSHIERQKNYFAGKTPSFSIV